MSSYTDTLYGGDVYGSSYGDDDFLGKGFFKKVGKLAFQPIKQAIKVVKDPRKELKAAITTTARFDPTSSTAKYGKATRIGLIAAGAIATTVLTAGAAAPALAAIGITGGAATAAGAGAAGLVGLGVKKLTGPAAERQALAEANKKQEALAQPLVPPPGGFPPPPGDNKKPILIAAGIATGLILVLALASTKKRRTA
jgi:hypothetical protein